MKISVRSNIKEVTRGLSRLEKKYIPNATRNAINDTLFGLSDALSKEMKSVFDEPVTFTTGPKPSPFIIDKVKKGKSAILVGEIKFKQRQAAYLQRQVHGGIQRPKKRAIPFPHNKQQASHGGLKKNWSKILDNKKYFSGTVKKKGGGGESRPGVFLRKGRRRWSKSEKREVGQKFVLQISWEEQSKYQKQFDFYGFSQRYVRRHFTRNFREKLRWYVQNRK